MTVCVAALSSRGMCIVAVADKALSYGDYLQWDSDTNKIIPLPSKHGVMMISGGEDATRVIERILKIDDLGVDLEKTRSEIERAYQTAYEEVIDIRFFKQNRLTRQDYVAGISGGHVNVHLHHIAQGVERFVLDCDLIVCGYDAMKQPFILSVCSPGKVVDLTREGFHAIGSGYEHALSRLLMTEHKRTHGVSRTLYECFDAKAHAELASSVGYEWDAYLVTAAGSVPMPETVKPLIDQIWAKANRSPFDGRKKDDLPNPPRDWQKQLMAIVAEMFRELGIATFADEEIIWPGKRRNG